MKELTSWQRKRLARYRKGWRKRLPEDKKVKIRAYHKAWMQRWRENNPDRAKAANRRAYQKTVDQRRALRPLPVRTGPYPVEETLPGHCKRCGILLSERGTPDGIICFGCHNELTALL